MFIVIINTKSRVVCITLTRDDLHNFSKTNWPDNFDRRLYMQLGSEYMRCALLLKKLNAQIH